MFYNARWYDSSLSRFAQADTEVPASQGAQAWDRYAYANNNPSRYTDPTGHWVSEGESGNLTQLEKAINAQKQAELEYDPSGQKQKANKKKAEAILYGVTELVASVLFEPADWAYSISHCANGDCSPWMLAGLLPFIPSSAGKYGDELIALVGRRGFETFDQLKKYLGPAGDNMQWHHIVEQSQIVKSGFDPRQVNNTGNIIAIDETIHRQISGYYSSIRPFTEGLVVRDWIAGQGFKTQYNFGLQVLRNFSVIP